MRIPLTILSFFLLCNLNGQTYNTQVIAPKLWQEIGQSDAVRLPVYLMLADQLDVQAMDRQLSRDQVPLQERTAQLINKLQNKAEQSQAKLLHTLRSIPDDIDPTSIRSYWITNLIFAEMSRAAIASLSNDGRIAWIGLNSEVKLEAFERNVTAPTDITIDGIEPGLKVIKAPELWKMGYSGYGRRALVIDTGTDTYHPALQTKFIGNYAPFSQAWFDTDPTEPFDCNDHGTHVCGTILGLDRLNNDTIGVAFNANWMASPPISCYRNSGFHGTERIIASFQWAMDPDGNPATTGDMPDVINNSWYDPGIDTLDCVSAYVPVFDALEAAGVAVIFSAGNEGPDPMTITPPHNINTDLVNSFTVGALNGNVPSLGIAGFSSRGPSQCGGQGSLLIKPEVSAPGEAVRSSVRNGGYDFFSGTSMASPHTCGAVLLLKEAFPYLTGHELKLAIYFSARDLGDPGEDNTYGMGIIDALAAYDYLINEGHVPVVPQVTTDLILINANLEKRFCEGLAYANIDVENGASAPISSFDILYELNGPETRSLTINWAGATLETGDRAFVQLPTFDNLQPGKYELSIQISLPAGTTEDRLLNNQFKRFIEVYEEIPVAVDALGLDADVACANAQVALHAAAGTGAEVRWYDSYEDGNLLATGPTFISPALGIDTTYFVDVIRSAETGLQSPDVQNSIIEDNINGRLYFDSYSTFTLKAVTVFAEKAGPRAIYLKNALGNTIGSKFFLLAPGEHRLELNFKVPPARGNYLRISEGLPLYYSTAAVQYPYSVPEILDIMGSNDTNDPQGTYYYFYNWEVEYGQFCGRTEVPLNRSASDDLPELEISADKMSTVLTTGNAEFTFDATLSADVVQQIWDFGDGSNPQAAGNPISYSYNRPGTFQVSLTAINAAGCTQTDSLLVEVTEMVVAANEVGEPLGVNIFPNPANELLHIQLNDVSHSIETIQLFDMLGRQLLMEMPSRPEHQLSLKAIPSGIYYVQLKTSAGEAVRKIIVEK